MAIVNISKRLKIIASLIPLNARILDVGCDHALLPIYIYNKGISNFIIASDNKEGPLNEAKKNLEKYDLLDKIPLILSDGLKNIDSTIDCLIIAGMGGKLLLSILENSFKKLNNLSMMILQPNGHESELRHFLINNGFIIENEIMLYEKIYKVIMVVRRGNQKLSENEIKYGPVLLKEKPQIFIEMIKKKINKTIKIIDELEKKQVNCQLKIKELEELKNILN